MKMRPSARVVALIAMVAAASVTDAVGQIYQFEIPPLPASNAIQEFARQANVKVLASSSALKDTTTKAVRGDKDAGSALTEMLSGTRLHALALEDGTYIIQLAQLAEQNIKPARPATSIEPRPAPTPPEDSHNSVELDQVLVSANRRDQRLQDVGVSITALGGQEMQDLNIRNSVDLIKAVPGFKIYAFSDVGAVFNIRGVSQTDFGDAAEPPIAVYQDDMYASSIAVTGFPIFDLQRVEVLRGPQGTLFGRNATGGAIQFVSNKPAREWSGYGDVTYADYNQKTVDGAFSGPITDNLQFRIAGIRDVSGGYLKNLGPGGDQGATDLYSVRTILAWQPASNTDIQFTTRYLDNDHQRQAGGYSGEPAYVGAHGQGEYLPANMPSPLAQVYFPGNNFGPGTDAGGYRNDSIYASRGGNPFTINTNYPAYFDRQIFGSTLHINLDFGALHLVSISDFMRAAKHFQEDADATPANLSDWIVNTRIRQFSQELRGAISSSNNNLTVGLYGLSIHGEYAAGYQLPVINYIPYSDKSLDTRSGAVFAQDEWTLSDRFTLIGGARYWHDTKTLDYRSFDNFGDLVIVNRNAIYPAFAGIGPDFARRNYGGVTLRAELDYRPVKDVLLYASYNRGGKAGGFTLPDDPPSNAGAKQFIEDLPYKSETLDAFELGAKTSLLPHTTFNVSAFHYNYKNYQAYSIVGTAESIFNKNASESGLEAELNWRPATGLLFKLGASYLNSTVKNVQLPDGSIASRNLPQAPGFSGNALIRYDLSAGPGQAYVQSDVLYVGSQCFTLLCAPVEKEHRYTVTGARVGYRLDNGVEISGSVENIFNTYYRIYGVDTAAISGTVLSDYGRPRTWSVTGTIHF